MLTTLVLLAAAAAPAPPAAATGTPLRHLVYSFTYDASQRGEVTNDPGSTGARNYSGNLNDSGTIAVDVMREGSDRGLVVVVSEQAKDLRSSAPATCAVYGNTNVVCEPDKTVNSEEYALLRFLGANFVDPAQVDDQGHWKVSLGDPASTLVTADYRIVSNDNGVLNISESRHETEHGAGTTQVETDAKITYDGPHEIPTKISDYTVSRQYGGLQANSTTTIQTTLNLVSDSMTKTP